MSSRLWFCRAAAGLSLAASTGVAMAQFSMVPSPTHHETPAPASATDEAEYRIEAARHVYAAYPLRIHKGKLPGMIYAVMVTDTEVDEAGRVVDVKVVRPPAVAKEVSPWVVQLIKRASPFPAPTRFANGSTVVIREIWLVDRTGLFQVDSLTEGQH